jgi:hypothetical protein
MIRILVFNLFYVVVCLFALVRGGPPERIGALILVADFELSLFVVGPMSRRFSGVEWPMFGVDFAAFAALYLLSILSARYWPIWMAALQGCVALSHLVGFRRDIIAWAYGTAVASWSYLLLAILAIATWRHIRRRAQFGIDPAWSWELPEAYRRSR